MTLYAIRVVHLTTQRAGLALTIAGLAGLLVAIPVGHLADRRGPRDVFRLALFLLAAAAVSYVFAVLRQLPDPLPSWTGPR